MPSSMKQKLAMHLAGNTALNKKALIIHRSLNEVEKLISPSKNVNTKKKK